METDMDTLSTDEKMLIFLIRKQGIDVKHLFVALFEEEE